MNIYVYGKKLRLPSRHVRVHAARYFADVAGGMVLKCLMLLAHINTFVSVGILLQYFCQELQV